VAGCQSRAHPATDIGHLRVNTLLT
jgi:hypothetical protein